jgi:hypothetical protein
MGKWIIGISILVLFALASVVSPSLAQQPATQPAPAKTQAELEADLEKTLTNATLEGSFNFSGNTQQLRTDRYSLGIVKKGTGKLWMIQAKMDLGGGEMTIPISLPIEWAGDTPVIVVDNLTFPGMGTYSARVMIFDGTYSGYWKHGERGGLMFGVVKPAGATTQQAAHP